jgi:hypothetical protein
MPALRQSLQASAILALDLSEAAAHDLALRYEHEVEPAYRLDLVSPEAFSEEPLRAVPLDRPADPSSHRQPQTTEPLVVLDSQQQEQSAIEPKALTEDLSKLRGAPDALARLQLDVRQRLLFSVC